MTDDLGEFELLPEEELDDLDDETYELDDVRYEESF
jgi:hypothetical protein